MNWDPSLLVNMSLQLGFFFFAFSSLEITIQMISEAICLQGLGHFFKKPNTGNMGYRLCSSGIIMYGEDGSESICEES